MSQPDIMPGISAVCRPGLIPAVVTPLDEHMGLDIARSLGKRGIPVYGVDSDPKAPGRFSKYIRFVQGPDPHESETEYVQFLLDLGGRLGERAVLYPLSDRHVLIASRHRARLQEYFEFVMPAHQVMERLTTKDGLQAVAQETGILSPQTFHANGDSRTIAEIAARVRYPVILKPTESTYWHTPEIAGKLRSGLLSGRPKVVRCDSPAELQEAYQRIAAHDSRLVVQEVVPGEDSRLVYFSFYLDRDSEPLAIFAGRKLRVIPTGFGSASYVRSFYDEELEDTALKLLSAVGYQGLGGLEFKRDPRSGAYQLIEFNTRFGMWDGLGARCGVDLAYVAYRDALRLPVEPVFHYRQGVIWVDWQRDLRAAIEYRHKGELSFGDWLRSLRGEKMWAIYSKDDWRPGAAFTLDLLHKLWDRLVGTAGGH
jgi:D-aspartate ligase